MCLAVPCCILSINKENKTAQVDILGAIQEVSLELINQQIEVGDFVLTHANFAISKMSREEAAESLDTYQQLFNI